MKKKDTFSKFKEGMKVLRIHSRSNFEEGIVEFPGNPPGMACVFNPCNLCDAKDIKVDEPFFGEDWKEFWTLCKKYFPLHSVHGSASSPEQILKTEQNYVKERIRPVMKNFSNAKVLEIGYGYGGTGQELMDKYGCKYRGIDYVSSRPEIVDNEHFYEIDKSGIPDDLMQENYDLIFSFNVMQHVTRKQREDYFNQVGKCLSDKGIFTFTCFEWNSKAKGPVARPDYNTKFFGVKTKIETEEEMAEILDKAGLEIVSKRFLYENAWGETNVPQYVCRKKRVA